MLASWAVVPTRPACQGATAVHGPRPAPVRATSDGHGNQPGDHAGEEWRVRSEVRAGLAWLSPATDHEEYRNELEHAESQRPRSLFSFRSTTAKVFPGPAGGRADRDTDQAEQKHCGEGGQAAHPDGAPVDRPVVPLFVVGFLPQCLVKVVSYRRLPRLASRLAWFLLWLVPNRELTSRSRRTAPTTVFQDE